MTLSVRPAGVLLLVAGLGACDLPTGMPRWDTTWIAPGEETTVSVVELLPPGLSVNEDTSAFVLAIDPVNASWALSEFCAACPAVAANAPKPAFSSTVATAVPLDAAIEAAVIESGSVEVELTNGFDFDPLRPGVASDSGTIELTLRAGATELGSLVIDGASTSFSPGATLSRTLDFLPVTVGEALTVELTLDSPAGDETMMTPTDALGMVLESDGAVVAEATVALSGHTVQGAEAELDLEDIDIDRIKEGTIFVDIDNPFAVGGDLDVTIDPASGAPIVKPVAMAPGTSTVQMHFSESEMAQLVGTVSQLTIGGTLDDGSVTLAPGQVIRLNTRLRVTIEVGGSDDDDGE